MTASACLLCCLELVEVIDAAGVSHGFWCDLCDAPVIADILEGVS